MSRQSVGRIKALVEAAVEDYLMKATMKPLTTRGASLGTAGNRYQNVYVGDLHMQNERGDFTIMEEEEHLSIRNNKTGKLYKFVLEEIEEKK